MKGFQHGLVVTDTVTYRPVGVLHVQYRAQGLVHHVDDVKGTGVAVEIDIQLLVAAHFFTAVFMQQFVAVLQRATGKQQAALLFVIMDVGFHRYDVEGHLCSELTGHQGEQHQGGQ